MKHYVWLMDRLSIACAVVASVLLAASAVLITWMVLYRAMGYSTYWEIELSVYMMVASMFLASPYTLMTKGHVSVDLLEHYLPFSARRALLVILALLSLAVCGWLAWATFEFALHAYTSGERSESAWSPLKWPLFMTMPIGFGLTALQYIAELARPETPEAA
ncbi:TRAP transporter small permease subunit [Zeimonas arvi]|uniref:TRAP transporter small permease protein n=1 Tax=Zeimonas arvi TaxID=2498847 RepID=A0A5C8NTX0_9BURK|nr:TRAP transporter small permease subunit [Zeimonas arvi]TXL64585.1 TRAP transporter small permease subunit [Zeimonas arvi]